MKRRGFVKNFSLAAGSAMLGGCASGGGSFDGSESFKGAGSVARADGGGDPTMRGPFPILSTPYDASGEVDFQTLSREARFVCGCCCNMIWPQSGDSIDLLTVREKLDGMEAIAKALQGSGATVAFGCNGKDIPQMVEFVEHVEALAGKYKNTRIAIISRPPESAQSQADVKKYFLELEKHTERPAIIQTVGGISCGLRDPVDVDLLIELAKRNPKVFGYVKEETGNAAKCAARMSREIASKPSIHTVYSAWGATQWLFQARRIGSEGVITERPAYADLLAHIWSRMENGDANGTLADAFSKLLLAYNFSVYCKGGTLDDLRGAHLYVLQKRSVFKNRISREYEKVNGRLAIPKNRIVGEFKMSRRQTDEIDACLGAMRPYINF